MHNGLKANPCLVNAYTAYIPFATPAALCVSEVPEFPAPILGDEIQITLRGVVGFSYILIKILVSLDTELLCSVNAEKEFISRYQNKHTIVRTLKPDSCGAERQVMQYVKQCGFPTPLAINGLMTFLLGHHLVSK